MPGDHGYSLLRQYKHDLENTMIVVPLRFLGGGAGNYIVSIMLPREESLLVSTTPATAIDDSVGILGVFIVSE